MKIAVVTGASSGLGREYARLLAQGIHEELDEIWIIARRAERLEQLKKEIADLYMESKPGQHSDISVRVISADLTDRSEISKIAGFYAVEKPQVRILINAAGAGKIGSFCDLSAKDSAFMIDLDCCAPVMMCQETIPYMEKGARILNVCSTAAFQPLQFLAVYAASKSFLYRYSRALRVELFSKSISVTAVCPYWVKDTEFIPVAEGGKNQKNYIRSYPLASREKTVAAWSLWDTYRRFAVSTPGPVCILHRIVGKFIPSELMMGIWALARRI